MIDPLFCIHIIHRLICAAFTKWHTGKHIAVANMEDSSKYIIRGIGGRHLMRAEVLVPPTTRSAMYASPKTADGKCRFNSFRVLVRHTWICLSSVRTTKSACSLYRVIYGVRMDFSLAFAKVHIKLSCMYVKRLVRSLDYVVYSTSGFSALPRRALLSVDRKAVFCFALSAEFRNNEIRLDKSTLPNLIAVLFRTGVRLWRKSCRL